MVYTVRGKSTETLPDIPDLNNVGKRQDIIWGKKSEIPGGKQEHCFGRNATDAHVY